MDSAVPADQECAVSVFTQTLYAVRLVRQRIEFWRTGSPSPQPSIHSPRPQIALAVFEQTDNPTPKGAILSIALDAAVANRRETSSRNTQSGSPYPSFAIL